MPSFIYSPQVRVHIAADGTNLPDFANNIYDISDDLVQGSLVIRTNGVHTFNFQLQNTQRKYDGVFQPMDRITVEMKRITWVRVFSGYLNNGPVFSAWPRVLNMSASCTLKRLQYWFWDPTTKPAYELVTGALTAHNSPTLGNTPARSPVGGQAPAVSAATDALEALRVGAGTDPLTSFWEQYYKANPGQRPIGPASPATPPTNPAQDQAADGSKTNPAAGTNGAQSQQKFDDSIKGVVLKLFNEVIGWPQDKIHIGSIPETWVKLASEVGNKFLQAGDVRDLLGDFKQGNQSAPGIDMSNPNGPVPPGTVMDWVKAGLTLAQLPLSYAPGLAQQAMHESHGNPKAVQDPRVVDVNTRNGNPAKGLCQMIPETFMSNAVPGHTDIFNPIHNSASAARYALKKYGAGWFATGNHHNRGY